MRIKNSGEKLFKIFIVVIISILCLTMLYASIKFSYAYFKMSDEQICSYSDSTLINGTCHSEGNRSVNEQKNMFLFGGIAFPIVAVLLIFYLIIILKTKFKGK